MRLQLQGRFTCGVANRANHKIVPDSFADRLRVSVDGDVLRSVVAADTFRGWADVIRRDAKGDPIMLDGVPQLERRQGRVEAVILNVRPIDVDRARREGLALE